jgi:uncharacterized membrane protein
MPPRRMEMNKLNIIIKMESNTILTIKMKVVIIMARIKIIISKISTLLLTKKMMMQLSIKN